jgi:quinol monooxygenase YgiN
MSITVIAKIKAKAGSEAELEQAFRSMISKVRTEPGNEAYVLHRSVRDPTVFMFYEVYKDREALDTHSKTPHMAEMVKTIGALIDGRPQIDILTELDRR